ncbi:MAG: hypothetical protein Q8J88_16615 [Bacteroidales bacterium]|nr:hypothetical protein [Bacteroidales bacterium]
MKRNKNHPNLGQCCQDLSLTHFLLPPPKPLLLHLGMITLSSSYVLINSKSFPAKEKQSSSFTLFAYPFLNTYKRLAHLNAVLYLISLFYNKIQFIGI